MPYHLATPQHLKARVSYHRLALFLDLLSSVKREAHKQKALYTGGNPARVAQWIEHLASNQGVVGSIPAAGTIRFDPRFARISLMVFALWRFGHSL